MKNNDGYLSMAKFISKVSMVPVSTWKTYNMVVVWCHASVITPTHLTGHHSASTNIVHMISQLCKISDYFFRLVVFQFGLVNFSDAY